MNLLIFVSVFLIIVQSISCKLWFTDPELFMNTTQIIKYHGYPVEDYNVTTKDGYILNIHRIPYGRLNNTRGSRSVVFLQHGLVDSSFTWVNNFPNQSLGYILADAGYDVWLGNSRGNVYSLNHVKYSIKEKKFWNFSWDDMVKYDLDATIDFILNKTKQPKLSYVGHSQGTLIAFAKFSQNSSLNKKISSFTALAPVIYVGHLDTGIKYLSYISGGISLIFNMFSNGEFLPSDKLTQIISELVCGSSHTDFVCTNLLFLIAGYDINNLNMTRLPIYLGHTPAGTSVKNMVHYAQGYLSNEFLYYDYGTLGNLMHYRSTHPPAYQVTTHGIPVGMFWGGKDDLADPSDVTRAIRELDRDVKYNLYIEEYNHMDFIWGENAANLLYKDVLTFIRRYL